MRKCITHLASRGLSVATTLEKITILRSGLAESAIADLAADSPNTVVRCTKEHDTESKKHWVSKPSFPYGDSSSLMLRFQISRSVVGSRKGRGACSHNDPCRETLHKRKAIKRKQPQRG